ncbi:hypothetical protein PoB_004227300 [Plakobranchus ocellatus]|uniref:Uncharacterized protein n=1 Tax=Plakobranchus ocellatus TaxID=259542 RepID=A0AAV4B9D5_9GAST|nr:hypothetical protein PoB_004227300 [Plakobranchus ocellatus]
MLVLPLIKGNCIGKSTETPLSVYSRISNFYTKLIYKELVNLCGRLMVASWSLHGRLMVASWSPHGAPERGR